MDDRSWHDHRLGLRRQAYVNVASESGECNPPMGRDSPVAGMVTLMAPDRTSLTGTGERRARLERAASSHASHRFLTAC
jgi:hypothetical protein